MASMHCISKDPLEIPSPSLSLPLPLSPSLSLSLSLQDEFGYNAETQKLLCKNGDSLLGAINFFVCSINTLINKTMEDTLLTIRLYEAAR